VAIILVLVVHGGMLEGTGYSFIGVDTFFVLSGFLITSLLLREYDQTSGISLRHFYIRRALRLLPLLITMLLVLVVIAVLMDPFEKAVQEMYEALRALFYFTNWARIYSVGQACYLSHTWSLSIEEQFYFIWPVLLLLMVKRNSRNSLLCWVLLGVALSVASRILLYLGTDTKTNPYRLWTDWIRGQTPCCWAAMRPYWFHPGCCPGRNGSRRR